MIAAELRGGNKPSLNEALGQPARNGRRKSSRNLATEEEQVDALWNEIFKTCRVYEADPVAAWDAHEARLLSKADVLNAEQFDSLHYTAPNGTDLTIGMPQNHIWESAGSVNAQNEKFIANMPTEEVFSAPDFRRIDGVVKSTKPLSYAGNIIDGMTFPLRKRPSDRSYR